MMFMSISDDKFIFPTPEDKIYYKQLYDKYNPKVELYNKPYRPKKKFFKKKPR